MTNPDPGKSSTGLQINVAATLCYAMGFFSGLIFFLIEKQNKTVRFHAMQSMLVFGVLLVLQAVLPVVPVIGWTLMPLVSLAGLVLWILLMIKAYQGEKFKLPIVGDIAEQKS